MKIVLILLPFLKNNKSPLNMYWHNKTFIKDTKHNNESVFFIDFVSCIFTYIMKNSLLAYDTFVKATYDKVNFGFPINL